MNSLNDNQSNNINLSEGSIENYIKPLQDSNSLILSN